MSTRWTLPGGIPAPVSAPALAAQAGARHPIAVAVQSLDPALGQVECRFLAAHHWPASGFGAAGPAGRVRHGGRAGRGSRRDCASRAGSGRTGRRGTRVRLPGFDRELAPDSFIAQDSGE